MLFPAPKPTEKIEHLTTISHEGKIVVFAVSQSADARQPVRVLYTVKQDGFETNAGQTKLAGWENWQAVPFPADADDESVLEKEKKELTYGNEQPILRSCYDTENSTALAPVQVVSAFSYIYIFRQSVDDRLFVDRFVLNGMDNSLGRKLEVRFKRSGTKYQKPEDAKKNDTFDSLDFRDINGNFFYEPTTELSLLSPLDGGDFAVVLLPTNEQERFRWHIFSRNKNSGHVEIVSIRASKEGLFDVSDEIIPGTAVTTSAFIPGIIRRVLNIPNKTILSGLAATKYDIQVASKTAKGEDQLLKDATRVMLAVPTTTGTVTVSFAVAVDGTLSQIDENPDSSQSLRNDEYHVLLPANTLEEIKAQGRLKPPPGGAIELLKQEEKTGQVVVGYAGNAQLEYGQTVHIKDTGDFNRPFTILRREDDNNFVIDAGLNGSGIGEWELEPEEKLVFDGQITAVSPTADGKLRVTCINHGLEAGEEVQISGTSGYDGTFPISLVDEDHFLLPIPWAVGEGINLEKLAARRRGIRFGGVEDYIETPSLEQDAPADNLSWGKTLTAWVSPFDTATGEKLLIGQQQNIVRLYIDNGRLAAQIPLIDDKEAQLVAAAPLPENTWSHCALTVAYDHTARHLTLTLLQDGEIVEYKCWEETAVSPLPNTDKWLPAFWIGGTPAGDYFHGKIADVQIWNLCRSTQTIANLRFLPLLGRETGLSGFWRLTGIVEGPPRTVADFSVQQHDAILHGSAFVSSVTLSRTLDDGKSKVEAYINDQLFPVTRWARYEENFEYRTDTGEPTAFDFKVWGKKSHRSEDEEGLSVTVNDPVDLGDGWFRASCSFQIDKEVRLVRAFGIAQPDGTEWTWNELEIRRHQIRMVSNSITETTYADTVDPPTLVDSQADLRAQLQDFARLEAEEAGLFTRKSYLEGLIEAKQEEINIIANLEKKIKSKNEEIAQKQKELNNARANKYNYWCYITSDAAQKKGLTLAYHAETGNIITERKESPATDRQLFFFAKIENSGKAYPTYALVNKANPNDRRISLLRNPVSQFIALRSMGFPLASLDCSTKLVQESPENSTNPGTLIRIGTLPGGAAWPYLTSEAAGPETSLVILDSPGLGTFTNSIYYTPNNQWLIFEPVMPPDKGAITDLESELQKLSVEKASLEQDLENAKVLENLSLDDLNSRLKVTVDRLNNDVAPTLTSLNASFLDGIQDAEAEPQVMADLHSDKRELTTTGAVLPFVQPTSRLNMVETCEGNIQLSYVDDRYRLRLTHFDATSDAFNAEFEEWVPDAISSCLNILDDAIIKPQTPLLLGSEWSIEAWFYLTRPETQSSSDDGEASQPKFTLAASTDAQFEHVVVTANGEIGTWVDGRFHGSTANFNDFMPGWHHLAIVGTSAEKALVAENDEDAKSKTDGAETQQSETGNEADKKKERTEPVTIVYVDGKEVGRIKNVRCNREISVLGNSIDGQRPFGRLAELRIWGIALRPDEVANNSKTKLSGMEPGLLVYYLLNEAAGTKIRDFSQHGNPIDAEVTQENWWLCSAPIGHLGNQVIHRFGDLGNTPISESIGLGSNDPQHTIEMWLFIERFPDAHHAVLLTLGGPNRDAADYLNYHNWIIHNTGELQVGLVGGQGTHTLTYQLWPGTWNHLAAVYDGDSYILYVNGQEAGNAPAANIPISQITLQGDALFLGYGTSPFSGAMAEVRIWDRPLTLANIQQHMHQRLVGNEASLVSYWPLDDLKIEGSQSVAFDHGPSQAQGYISGARLLPDTSLPVVRKVDGVVSADYPEFELEPLTNRKVALMRRFFAWPTASGVHLLPGRRVEYLDLFWIGNAQFEPTLLGYIEGPPPVPSENLTIDDDYNGATSITLTRSENVSYSWNREESEATGFNLDLFAGFVHEDEAGFGYYKKLTDLKIGFQGNYGESNVEISSSNISASHSIDQADSLSLRGTFETDAKFPHLGRRFVPKNIGYALVISGTADVYIYRLRRSGRMVSYHVQPNMDIPPDVNTITFLINPAYTMNGSLDGLTGSQATSERFFHHIPQMRAQYGSNYPASYFRVKEAYDLQSIIEIKDKNRESFFQQFVLTTDEDALMAILDSTTEPEPLSLPDEAGAKKDSGTQGQNARDEDEKRVSDAREKSEQVQEEAKAEREQRKQELQNRISSAPSTVHAQSSLKAWQKKMEAILISAAKRNIVNKYVWDADGGLRAEAEQFATAIEHTIGGSYNVNYSVGGTANVEAGFVGVDFTGLYMFDLTQTITKTRSSEITTGLEIDLEGIEYRGITDYNDYPLMPGEKVDRYRFMSFYLEGSENNFDDFFANVVDPEWLASNDEEARALRQVQAGKKNKAWRVLHRVTYVERPSLMGFGRDMRQRLQEPEEDAIALMQEELAQLKEQNGALSAKIDQILRTITKG